jgi:adenylate cyclase
VKGKIVIWGVNPGRQGRRLRADLREVPRPEFQATVLDNLLQGDRGVPVGRGTDLAVLALISVLCGALSSVRLPRGVGLGAVTAVAAGFVFLAYRLFAGGTSIDLVTPVVGAFATWAGVTGYRLLTEGKRNKWLEGTFSQYLAPAVIKAIKADPSMLALGGRQRELSVLFSDVKGFTTISETLGPEHTVRLLNDYLSRQSEPVLQNDGVIDKFIGDAVMAFFGEPVAHADHALRACRAAVESLAVLAGTQPLARELGIGTLVNRIGVASGPATIGNIGSDRRFNYTAIGDTVNFASRLEGANKAFGSRILLADATYQAAKDAVVAKPLAKLIVVGKTEPVEVFELVGLRGEAPDDLVRHAEAFTRAHAAVRARTTSRRAGGPPRPAVARRTGPAPGCGCSSPSCAPGATPTLVGILVLDSK